MKSVIILVLLFCSIHNSFSQKSYIVTAKSGLSIRNEPSIKGNKIGKLKFKERITIIEKTDFSFITEKIQGYWVRIRTEDLQEGYVFNGFLKPFASNKIIYTIIRNEENIHQKLTATINDKESTIVDFDDQSCFEIIEIQDYNNDGFEEVLLESNACGGNCCGNSLFVFSFNGVKFISSDHIGYYFGDMVLNYDKNNTRHFIVANENIGVGNTTLCEDKKETYVFENYNFKLINSQSDNKLNTIIELKSSDFLSKESDVEYLSIQYDLDNNGIKDEIITKYWERWGLLFDCKIIFNNTTLETDVIGSPKRIGILESKTNNVNDLVVECDQVLKWNGSNYEKE